MPYLRMQKFAIFLSGPIGVGKSSLGRALAKKFGGRFIDGDDHSDPDHPWHCSILKTSRAVLREAIVSLEEHTLVVIAYPLRCTTWVFYKRHMNDVGVLPIFINLTASFEEIVSPSRRRSFSDAEKFRIEVMIQEGYGERPFGDMTFKTADQSFEDTLQKIASEVAKIAGNAS